ncbi:hypothetical protein GCM10009083_21770 [Halopseudomonas pertucinogena]|uniref:Uncharacterized protein n=1 Tax=Halopseudomonas pertucinogena TaxID=86175 RepID=A0ABQ2CR18_9GAMM|nr:hypothetical protein GCM10009083_21770 [Halopseudomonas pertucinogena]
MTRCASRSRHNCARRLAAPVSQSIWEVVAKLKDDMSTSLAWGGGGFTVRRKGAGRQAWGWDWRG